jgi:hypothetical protein
MGTTSFGVAIAVTLRRHSHQEISKAFDEACSKATRTHPRLRENADQSIPPGTKWPEAADFAGGVAGVESQ